MRLVLPTARQADRRDVPPVLSLLSLLPDCMHSRTRTPAHAARPPRPPACCARRCAHCARYVPGATPLVQSLMLKKVSMTAAEQRVYAYGDESVDDFGWGCAYRNIQTVLHAYDGQPPRFMEIFEECQAKRAEYGRQPNEKLDDRWIEPHQCGCYLRERGIETTEATIGPHSVMLQCTDPSVYYASAAGNRVLEAGQEDELLRSIDLHFALPGWALPIIIDDGAYSYCILGVRLGEDGNMELLIGDPHRARPVAQAGGPLGQLTSMGFGADVSEASLKLSKGDLQRASELLLTDMSKCVAAAAEAEPVHVDSGLAEMPHAVPTWKPARSFLRLDRGRACWAFLFPRRGRLR